jgi:hypothetical protein
VSSWIAEVDSAGESGIDNKVLVVTENRSEEPVHSILVCIGAEYGGSAEVYQVRVLPPGQRNVVWVTLPPLLPASELLPVPTVFVDVRGIYWKRDHLGKLMRRA